MVDAPPNADTGPHEPPLAGGYADVPPERDEKGSSGLLLVAVNFVILAVAIWWVVYKVKSGPAQPEGVAGTRTGTVADTGTGPNTGVAPLEPISPSSTFDPNDERLRPRSPEGIGPGIPGGLPGENRTAAPGTRDREGRRVLKPKPLLAAVENARSLTLKSAIDKLGPSLEVYKAVAKDYPSSKRADYGANRGIELLVEEMQNRRALDPAVFSMADTDGDGRMELIDPWGNALVYFSNDDYAGTQTLSGGATIAARERWVEDTPAWQGQEQYQLFSLGANGADDFGGYDDINSWETWQ